MRLRSIATLALIAAVAGCDSSDPVAPQVDVDAALAEMTVGAAAYADFGMGTFVTVPYTRASDCSYDAPSGYFKCAPITAGGITFIRQFQLLDASGAPLSSINPLAIASIRSVRDVNGMVTPSSEDPITITLKRHDDATLSGVQSINRVLNGTATQEIVVSSSTDHITMNDTTVTAALQLPSTQQKYPLGGTVVSSGAIQENASAAETYRVEMSFDGTSIVIVKTTIGGLTSSCKVNMANPNADPICT